MSVLRGLIPAELAKGFGFFQSKPSSAFSPVAVTPDELGDAWDGGKLHLPLHVDLNGKPFGRANAGVDMTFDFPTLIAHAAKTRPLAAGTIIGSGTVSNKLDGGPGKPVAEGGVGYSCIAEMRTVETIARRRAEDAVPALRRHGAHRDEGQGRPFDLRRNRADRGAGRPRPALTGGRMAKSFASTGDVAEKRVAFDEIGRGLYAFTAEGDPNTGIVIGDDSVMVVDAQATPRLARKVIEKIRGVTDKPIKYVVLTHYHAVRVLGASAYGASEVDHVGAVARHGGRARARRTGSRNSAAFPACSRAMRRSPA